MAADSGQTTAPRRRHNRVLSAGRHELLEIRCSRTGQTNEMECMVCTPRQRWQMRDVMSFFVKNGLRIDILFFVEGEKDKSHDER